jgi:hypothetical protein
LKAKLLQSSAHGASSVEFKAAISNEEGAGTCMLPAAGCKLSALPPRSSSVSMLKPGVPALEKASETVKLRHMPPHAAEENGRSP